MMPTTASPSVSFTSAHITLAPSSAKIFAVEAPMPDAAPVTMATLSLRRMGFLQVCGDRQAGAASLARLAGGGKLRSPALAAEPETAGAVDPAGSLTTGRVQ